MTDGGTVLFGAVGTVAAMLAVLVPVIRAQGAILRREIDTLRADVAEVRRDLHTEATAIRADLHALAERVARIEGAMNPWRPTNGATAPSSPPEEAAP